MSTTASSIALETFTGLVDDAAIFPPGNASMAEALRSHVEHRSAWYATAVGPFVCSDTRLPELQQALVSMGDDAPSSLHVSLTISGGAGAIEPAVTWAGRDERLSLTAVEVALRDETDLAHNAARMTTMLGGVLHEDALAYVEPPRLHGEEATAGWSAALDEIAAAGHRLKLRTGGVEPEAFPSSAELAVMVTAALDREVAFKCTAGLHNAVRHTAADTGFEHHGFLNVLLATRAILDGAAVSEMVELLERRDATAVADMVALLGPDRMRSARRWFGSFGSCSITEPVDDLVDLGLISKGATT